MLATLLLSITTLFHTARPVPPTYGFPDATPPAGHLVSRVFYLHPYYSRKLVNGEMVPMPTGTSFSKTPLVLKLRAGLTHRLAWLANVPLVWKRLKTPLGEKKGAGVGDILTGPFFRLGGKGWNGVTAVALAYLPTGKYRNLAKNELALGRGSSGIVAALATGGPMGKARFRLSATYVGLNKGQPDYIWGVATLIVGSTWQRLEWELSLLGERELSGVHPLYYLKAFLTQHLIIGRGKVLQFTVVRNLASRQAFAADWEVWFQTYWRVPLLEP